MMKKIGSIVILMLTSVFVGFAQNTFPANGNVGINIAPAPVGSDFKLFVGGSTANIANNGGVIGSFASLSSSWSELSLSNKSGFNNSDVIAHMKVEDGQVEIGSRSNHPVEIGAGDNSNHLRIMPSGNVGVGILNPAFKLDVNGGIRSFGGVESQGSIAGNHAFYSNFSNGEIYNNWINTGKNLTAINLLGGGNEHSGFGVVDGSGVHSPVVWMYNHTDNAFLVRAVNYQSGMSGGNDLMVVRHDGKVGIGTTNLTSTLNVNGDIVCEKIRVIGDVPSSDHVFEPEYNLRSLEEVEDFIKNKKHLPEIPSAVEFKANGYSVGEMDDLLLRKVEELTLYIIELKKEINELKNK